LAGNQVGLARPRQELAEIDSRRIGGKARRAVGQLTRLVRLIGETHHLDRDGDLQQFYLQDLAVLEVPRLFFEFGAMRAAAAPVAAQMLAVTQDQEAKLYGTIADIRFLIDNTRWKLDSLVATVLQTR